MKGHVPLHHTHGFYSPSSRPTKEEEQAYIERARTGGIEEQHAFLLSFRGYIHTQAARYVRQWNSPRIEYDDLEQEGGLAAAAHLEQALAHQTPYPYLRKVIVKAMAQYCYDHITPIRKPRHRKEAFSSVPVMSLDALLSAEGQTTHLDLLALSGSTTPQKPADDYPLLHRAIERLPRRQREVIKRHFGFEGMPETLHSISRSLQPHPHAKRTTKAYTYQRKALGRLRTQLPALAGMTPDQIRERHIGTLPFHLWEVPL